MLNELTKYQRNWTSTKLEAQIDLPAYILNELAKESVPILTELYTHAYWWYANCNHRQEAK